jgi:hypothetical protein
MSLRFNWAISLPPDHAKLFFLRITIKNVQHPRNSIATHHAQPGALHNLKPPTDMPRATTASSELEGKELDGFPIFAGILSKQ